MNIKTIMLSFENLDYSDDDITNYLNDVLKENDITSDNLIDIKLSSYQYRREFLIIYKEN